MRKELYKIIKVGDDNDSTAIKNFSQITKTAQNDIKKFGLFLFLSSSSKKAQN